jgi:hypothetical protein
MQELHRLWVLKFSILAPKQQYSVNLPPSKKTLYKGKIKVVISM